MERYTPQAKEALSLAVGMAESLNHGYVGTEHLLIGLLQEGTGVAARVLEENGVEESKVVELVSQLISPNTSVQMAENAAYTPRARRVIENSYRDPGTGRSSGCAPAFPGPPAAPASGPRRGCRPPWG